MKRYDLQGIQLEVPARTAFGYVSDASRLPEWTNAFVSIDGSRAVMRTAGGEVSVELETLADEKRGTVDTKMTFPDGSSGWAYSRVVPLDDRRCLYEFVLTAPPGPLEELEGTLEEQSRILAEELSRLKKVLES